MKKSGVTTLILTLLVSASLYAQEQLQTVRLKSGEVFTGTVLEKIDGKVLKLRIKDKDVQSFRWEDIDTTYAITERHIKNWEKTKKLFFRMARLKDKGYSGVFHLGFTNLVQSSSDNVSNYYYYYDFTGNAYEGYYFHFTTAHGYQFNPHVALRIGFGIEVGAAMIIPFFGEIQVNALKRRFTPIFLFSPGYSLCFDKQSSEYGLLEFASRGGGFYLTASVGFRYSFAPYYAMQLTFGPRYQTVNDTGTIPKIYGYSLRMAFEF